MSRPRPPVAPGEQYRHPAGPLLRSGTEHNDPMPPPNPPSRWNPDDEVVARLVAATTQAWAAPGVVDLGIGQPHDDLLPAALFERAFAARPLREPHPLQYGGEAGDGYLRLALGAFLTEAYGLAVDPEPIFVTNGNSQALELVCATFARPGDVVLVEDPTYFLALDIFRGRGLRVVGVPVDSGGMDTDALEELVVEHRPAFVYTIPAFQNPTGATLTPERRHRMVELAQEHEFLVVADEVYQLLAYGTPAPPPFAAHVDSGVVLSLGTFSKILAPGLRLGWIQAAPPIVDRLAAVPYVVSGGGLNPFTSAVVRIVLERGWQWEHLTWLRGVLAERVAAMDAALRVHLPPEIGYDVPGGGYFFWLRFPPGTDTERWRAPAAARQVGFRHGTLFSPAGRHAECLRLSFAFYGADAIERGVAVLGEVIGGTG